MTIIDELLAINTSPTRHDINRMLSLLGLINPKLCPMILDLFSEKIVPFMLNHRLKEGSGILLFDVVIHSIIDITGVNVDVYWEKSQKILEYIINTINLTNNHAAVKEFGDVLILSCFHMDIRIGINTINYLLSRKLHFDNIWRPCILKVMAGMLARNPEVLRRILDKSNVEKDILKDVRPLMTKDLYELRDQSSYMMNWNRFISAVASKLTQMRYLFIKVVVAGLIQSNNVPEATREFRRFVIQALKSFFGDEQESIEYKKINLQEALSETESKRKIGGGEVWTAKGSDYTSI